MTCPGVGILAGEAGEAGHWGRGAVGEHRPGLGVAGGGGEPGVVVEGEHALASCCEGEVLVLVDGSLGRSCSSRVNDIGAWEGAGDLETGRGKQLLLLLLLEQELVTE